MKEYVLSYYPKFKCIAEKCQHTCCAGWTVNIDENTLSVYKNQASDFSKALKNGINFKKSKFKLDKSRRCAFLNQKNLCEIITNLGETSLCQVCRDHPRFKTFFDNGTEIGLGFCCERATQIILSYQDKIQPILIQDDENCLEPSFIQKQILKFRKNALLIIQDRNKNINDRINELLSLCDIILCERDFKKILKLFLSLERLDKSWSTRLKNLKGKSFKLKTDRKFSLYCEQFLANSLFRHISNCDDTMLLKGRLVACIISWWIIKSIFENEIISHDNFELICDIVRAFSSEVEYSQKNLNKLYSFSYKLIN